jgi:hypothetical protein
VNLPVGYQWESGRLYYYYHLANPFLSFVERMPVAGRTRRSPKTVMSGNHDSIGRRGRVRQVLSPPMWIQVVHGGNVINERLGVRRSVAGPPDRFPPIPLVAEGRLARQVDVGRSIGHLMVLGWQRRAHLQRRLTAQMRRR